MTRQYLDYFWSVLAKKPDILSLEITTRCPLDCVYCHRKLARNKNVELSFEQFSILKDKVSHIQRIILCGIGESFCHPAIYEMVHALCHQKVTLITSGTVPIDYDRLFRARNVELVVFSIDSPRQEVIKRICGDNYNYSALLNNLANLRRYPHVQRSINCTLNSYNVDHLPALIEFASAQRIPAVSFELPIGDGQFVQDNKALIQAGLAEAQTSAKQKRVFFDGPFRLKCCSRDYVVPYITLDGDLFPCCEALYGNYALGNVYQQDLDAIIAQETYQLFMTGDLCRNKCQTFSIKGFLEATRELPA